MWQLFCSAGAYRALKKQPMNDKTVLIIGIAASVCTAVCMLPQLIKIIKEKKAEDISLPMVITLLTGLALWITYGIMKKDLVIAISNGISVVINVSLMVLSIKYKTKKP
jgi:MtN3 and saliva related transmembrane protein